jgi:hypothetical protein
MPARGWHADRPDGTDRALAARDAEGRESATLRDAEVGVRIDERIMVKTSTIRRAGRGERQRLRRERGARADGPDSLNVVVVGLGHGLAEHGMTFGEDVLAEVVSSAARSSARTPSSCGSRSVSTPSSGRS